MHSTIIDLLGRRVRLGLVGGGGASLIGPVHRVAARFDDCLAGRGAPGRQAGRSVCRDGAERERRRRGAGVYRGLPDLDGEWNLGEG